MGQIRDIAADVKKIDTIEVNVTQLQSTQPTAVSQLTNDSGYQTLTQVNNAISALVNSAPSALNTLNELAAALGNDANFATTVTTSLAGKANQSTTYTKTEVDGALSGKQATLGFTPYNATNPSGYISGITAGMVTTALGYTPLSNATSYLPTSGGTLTGELVLNSALRVGGLGSSASNTIGANLGATTPSWNNTQLEIRNTDAGAASIAIHRAGYTSNTISVTDSNGIRIDGYVALTGGNFAVNSLSGNLLGGARIAGTTYTNSSTRPLIVFVSGSNSPSNGTFTIRINGTIIGTINGYGTSPGATLVIPSGATYSVTNTGATVQYWYEY